MRQGSETKARLHRKPAEEPKWGRRIGAELSEDSRPETGGEQRHNEELKAHNIVTALRWAWLELPGHPQGTLLIGFFSNKSSTGAAGGGHRDKRNAPCSTRSMEITS